MVFSKSMKQKSFQLTKPLLSIKSELKIKNRKEFSPRELTLDDKKLIQKIQRITQSFNLNNVTRTKAYLDFYNSHPDIHWAFLGHMVSRNGGWNMTDLKGELLSKLLSRKERNSFFHFLERGNWLIFQDAYPQFIVYEESKIRGQNLFYLLPHLNISVFMEVVWNHYWKERDTSLLTIALIINEQSYLEERVIKNTLFQKEILNSLEFKLQDLLSLNHILFPIYEKNKVKLIGQTLHHFGSLHERILLGKRLYSILFHDLNTLKMAEKWANSCRHTGSRKDYWPHIFHDINEGAPGLTLKSRLKSCQIIHGSPRFYSPSLAYAWKNSRQSPAEIDDWYKNWKILYYFLETKENINEEIYYDYCKTLERLELAAITKTTLSIFD